MRSPVLTPNTNQWRRRGTKSIRPPSRNRKSSLRRACADELPDGGEPLPVPVPTSLMRRHLVGGGGRRREGAGEGVGGLQGVREGVGGL